MSGIQQYRTKKQNKIHYRKQAYLPCGKRATFYFGSGRKKAEAASRAINDLIDSKNAGVCPDATTTAWLEKTAAKALCDKLLKYGLMDSSPTRFDEKQDLTISGLVQTYKNSQGAGKEKRTIAVYERSEKNLIQCFGDVVIEKLDKQDGRNFFRWLIETKNYSPNTAKQRLRYARSFFELAVEDGLIENNPFKSKQLTVTQSSAQKKYVSWEVIDKVINNCPELEWRLLFAMARQIPLRIPSEIQELKWGDVDWDQNTILIHSPKTRRIGKSARRVPLFDSLYPLLSEMRNHVASDEQFVFPKLHCHSNISTTGKKLVERAIDDFPENAGPHNPHMLAITSLMNMRDLSPQYLRRFAGYIETVLWLEKNETILKRKK